MKIMPLNNIGLSHKYNLSVRKEQDSPVEIEAQITRLSGRPASYVSFGTSEKDKQREMQIGEYFKYKEIAKKYENEDPQHPLHEEEAEKRIAALSNSRDSYGFFTGKFKKGKVSKAEVAKIKRESYEKYIEEKNKCMSYIKNKDYYEALISNSDNAIYENTKKILQDRFSVDNVIAGYDYEKKELKKLLIDPIQREHLLSTNETIPPSILIYGPIGCGKTKLAENIAEIANCQVKVLPPDVSPRKFTTEIRDLMEEAREYYAEQKNIINEERNKKDFTEKNIEEKALSSADLKSPRTIIVVNEVDRYFSSDPKDDNDQIADSNKTFMKGILDYCSEKPTESDSTDACGVTFLFTTNFPTKVDSEVALRSEKCTRFPLSLPSDADIKAIIKFYVENYANPTIKKGIAEGKQLNVIDANQLPYAKYIKVAKENMAAGFLNGNGIEQAVRDATDCYVANPQKPAYIKLAELLGSNLYRIDHKKYDEYYKEIEAMGQRYKDIDESEEYALLSELKDLDLIKEEQDKRLKYLKGVYEKINKDKFSNENISNKS